MRDLGDVVAGNIRAERARHFWRQTDLAQRMSWSVGMVSDTEAGKRRIAIEDIPLLCRALEVPLARLFVGADPDDLSAMAIGQQLDGGTTG